MRNTSFLALFVLPVAIVLTPAFSPASIYSWQDASGVTTYSNVPPAMPVNAQIAVRTSETVPAESSEMAGVEPVSAVQPQSPERSPYMATQAEFAVQLVKELGLGQPADAGQAADVLTNLRIAPPLGEWVFDQPMTPELTIRLRQLTVAAAGRGDITITPEQALLAFDTAAALLNVDIPASGDQETISDAPYPIADMPPLVDFYQPAPVFYPYYIWTPVYGGFWWGYHYFPGYWVLNVSLFCNHYYNHYFGYAFDGHHSYGHDGRYHNDGYRGNGARFASIDPAHISHHLNGHLEDHRLDARPSIPGRTVTSPGQPRSPFPSMRAGVDGTRASHPVATERVSYARSPLTYRGASRSLSSSPYRHTRSSNDRTYVSPLYRSSSIRAPYPSSRSMGRAAFAPPSRYRYGSLGSTPSRPSFHSGMGMTRAVEHASGFGRSSFGGRAQTSGRGSVSTKSPTRR